MTKNNIYQKIQIVQDKVGQLAKSEENTFQKYKYVPEYPIFRVIKPILNDQGLTITFEDIPEKDVIVKEIENKKGGKEGVIQYGKQAVITNTENIQEQIKSPFFACAQNTDIAKAKGSAETYSIKYFLMKFFIIPTSENLDPDERGPMEDGKKELTIEEKQQVEEFLKKHDLNPPELCAVCKLGFSPHLLKQFGKIKLCHEDFERKRNEVYGTK